ncbi:MAG: hypothetical protein WKF86_07780 [Acidimicrobiales bacterium]
MSAQAHEAGPGFIPEELWRSWFALAADLERRQADLLHLVTEVRRAIATFDKATVEWGDLSDESVDAARAAFGIARLSGAVDAAGLRPLLDRMTWAEVEALTAEAKGSVVHY